MRRSLQDTGCLLALTGLWLLTACVTVNIYFPAAAAEKAADRIIEDVWGAEAGAAQPPSAPAQEGRREDVSRRRLALWEGVMDILVPPAHAQRGDININTPAINRLTGAMAARFLQLEPYLASGAVGLTRDGLVTVRDANAVPPPERNRVNQLVAAENADRNALYQQIAAANGHPEWEPDIRATFARRWVDNARGGWWYQGADGAWRRK